MGGSCLASILIKLFVTIGFEMFEYFEKTNLIYRLLTKCCLPYMYIYLQLEADVRRLSETQKRTTQLELRFQRERESWRRERNEAQRKLQDSISTRRMEQSRVDSILAEVKDTISVFVMPFCLIRTVSKQTIQS